VPDRPFPARIGGIALDEDEDEGEDEEEVALH
jgi:hypothetical protein